MDTRRRSVESASRFLSFISQAVLAAMALLVGGNVILRQIGFSGILGTYELTGYLGAIMIAMSLAYTQVTGTNVVVELFVSHLSLEKQAVIDSIIFFIGTFLYLTIAFCCFEEGIVLWKRGEVSPTLSIPFLPIFFLVGFGCFSLCIVLSTEFFKSIRKVKR
jgi:TRAP-type C4-dicarboxylate transport system permease small subunit